MTVVTEVVTEVVTDVVVDGVGASVVVGAWLVVGVTVVVTVVGGGGGASLLLVGALWLLPWLLLEEGAGSPLVPGVDEPVLTLLVVTAGLSDEPELVNFTIA